MGTSMSKITDDEPKTSQETSIKTEYEKNKRKKTTSARFFIGKINSKVKKENIKYVPPNKKIISHFLNPALSKNAMLSGILKFKELYCTKIKR